MSFTTAVTLFTKQAVREQRIPFEITRSIPNDETIKALNEYKEMSSKDSKYKRYDSFDDLLKERDLKREK